MEIAGAGDGLFYGPPVPGATVEALIGRASYFTVTTTS
jgi:hypothetical protein